jgi:NDP-sugar pyrophosphorylase family protein
MQVMLLAAGRGTRLGELGLQTPKVMVEIGGKPLLQHQLEYLAREGAELVVINAHHLSEQIVEFVESREWPCRVELVVEPELLGTAGGLRGALSHFERHMPIAVLNGDTLIDAPLYRIMDEHIQSGLAGTICATWLSDTTGKGIITVDFAGNVTGFEEKPPVPRPGLASAGLYVLDRELAALIPPGVFCDLAHDLFPLALDLELGLRVEQLVGSFSDIGTPESLEAARAEATS